MTDRYSKFVTTSFGKRLTGTLGLPQPTPLRRPSDGGPALLGPVALSFGMDPAVLAAVSSALERNGLTATQAGAGDHPAGFVVDCSALAVPTDLDFVHASLAADLRSIVENGRVVFLCVDPRYAATASHAICSEAVVGIARSLGKEIGRGCTVNVVQYHPENPAPIAGTLAFLLSARSAFVSGQVITLNNTVSDDPADDATPVRDGLSAGDLTGKTAVVTGSARGIGAGIAQALAAAGATVVGVDVPSTTAQLAQQAEQLDGSFLALDIVTPDATTTLMRHIHEHHDSLDILVHNAGITRDRKLWNMSLDMWRNTIAVNLAAPWRITETVIADQLMSPGGRIIAVSSISGAAGNAGQTNYAATKAGLNGMVRAVSGQVAELGCTVNAVAPGFIETDMTSAMPMALREAGRRLSSLRQGGLAEDVANTIAWLAEPSSYALNGQVVRVCGQSMVGA